MDSLEDFVSMENELSCQMCILVDNSINALKKVLFGSGLLTPSIQAVAISLLSGSVPNEWNKRWEGPEKPQMWLRELLRKRISLMKLKTTSAKGSILDAPVALGDLFNPSTFVNALRQQTARKLSLAIDKVKMIAYWDGDRGKNSASRLGDCPLPCTLSTMLLQGAVFQSVLKEGASDASELSPSPNVSIGFVPIAANDPYSTDEMIHIPVYLTPSREDFLMDLPMPSDRADRSKWILSGVALFLSEGE
jgi:dynein heavy chain 2